MFIHFPHFWPESNRIQSYFFCSLSMIQFICMQMWKSIRIKSGDVIYSTFVHTKKPCHWLWVSTICYNLAENDYNKIMHQIIVFDVPLKMKNPSAFLSSSQFVVMCVLILCRKSQYFVQNESECRTNTFHSLNWHWDLRWKSIISDFGLFSQFLWPVFM